MIVRRPALSVTDVVLILTGLVALGVLVGAGLFAVVRFAVGAFR